jgi:RNA polymerase sigma-70 factor, ECF subfamily
VNIDDRIRSAMHALDATPDAGASYEAYLGLQKRYRERIIRPSSAVEFHRAAEGVESYFRGEEAGRDGRHEDALAHFSVAARAGVGDPPGSDDSADYEDRAACLDALEATIASAAASGDRVAVERVLRAIRPFVDALCRSAAFASGVADEVSANRSREVCLAVLVALPQYRPDEQPFLEFVHATALRALDIRGTVPAADPTEEQERARQDLHTALEPLTTAQRDVLVLRIVLGLSTERTAQHLGTTPGAVRVVQHTALARLRAAAQNLATLRLVRAQGPPGGRRHDRQLRARRPG